MFGKLRTGVLVLLVAVLAAIWWWSGRTSPTAQQRTFKSRLLTFDTTGLQVFTVVPAPARHIPVQHFRRTAKGWQLQSGADSTLADDEAIRELLGILATMRTIRVVGRMEDVRDRYELGDSTADRLMLDGPDGRHELLVGHTTEGEEPMTVVDLDADPEAYAVAGQLGVLVDRDFNGWVPKFLVRGDPARWQRLTFTFPGDTGYVLERHGDRWLLDGAATDPQRVERYLGSLARSRASALADPADTLTARPAFRLVVEDSTRKEPTVVMLFSLPDHFIARSTVNPRSIMLFDGHYEVPRMFRPRQAFLPGAPMGH